MYKILFYIIYIYIKANRYNQEVLEAQAAKKRKTVLSPIQTDITEFVLPSEEFDALISEQRKATSPASTSPSHSSETTEGKIKIQKNNKL